ncbi:ORF1 [Rhodiola cryptic virus 1]|nr:ORF1 [Rhodiola cryptic virus 1]
MEGLVMIGQVPTRATREQFQILKDEPVYEVVSKFASIADMQEIDGWARSFYTIEGHIESIMQYRKPLLPEPDEPAWTEAKASVMYDVMTSIPRVRSLSFINQLDDVPYESSSAAGYGYAGKKGEGDNFKRAKSITNALVRTYVERCAKGEKQEALKSVITECTPDVAFTRTQLARLPSIKVRNVFGEAFHYILIEGLSASPLLEAFKRADTFYVTGKDPTTYVPRFLSHLDNQPGWVVALDWSRFDATVQLWEIDHAFQCLENVLDFPEEYSRACFFLSKELFKKRKLAAPDGVMWMRTSGIPSGSYFTNLIGSIINYTRIKFLCNKLGYQMGEVRVQGDDSVFKAQAPNKPDVYAIAQAVADFGWELNPAKCVVTHNTDGLTFLGRGQYQLFNIRERLKVLRLLCFPEYEVDDPMISTARVKMICNDAGFRDMMYNKIYLAMNRLYGEAETVPDRYKTYVDLNDWQDVNM